jgi:hypothetical protein
MAVVYSQRCDKYIDLDKTEVVFTEGDIIPRDDDKALLAAYHDGEIPADFMISNLGFTAADLIKGDRNK